MTELLTTVPADPAGRADTVARRLCIGEKTWAATSLTRRRELLNEVAGLAGRHARQWVDIAAAIKACPRIRRWSARSGSPVPGRSCPTCMPSTRRWPRRSVARTC